MAEVVLCILQSPNLLKPWGFHLHHLRTPPWDHEDVKKPEIKDQPFKLPQLSLPLNLSAEWKCKPEPKLNQQVCSGTRRIKRNHKTLLWNTKFWVVDYIAINNWNKNQQRNVSWKKKKKTKFLWKSNQNFQNVADVSNRLMAKRLLNIVRSHHGYLASSVSVRRSG